MLQVLVRLRSSATSLVLPNAKHPPQGPPQSAHRPLPLNIPPSARRPSRSSTTHTALEPEPSTRLPAARCRCRCCCCRRCCHHHHHHHRRRRRRRAADTTQTLAVVSLRRAGACALPPTAPNIERRSPRHLRRALKVLRPLPRCPPSCRTLSRPRIRNRRAWCISTGLPNSACLKARSMATFLASRTRIRTRRTRASTRARPTRPSRPTPRRRLSKQNTTGSKTARVRRA